MKKFIAFILIVAALVSGAIAIVFLDEKPVNLLVYGLEGKRSDTIMIVMLNPSTDQIHVMHIPRDTYYPTAGHNGLGQSKLNATYGFKEGGGTAGLREAVENLTGLDIDYFVEVDYAAVKGVVDALGGVEVDVPFKMEYDDRSATPPLHIDFDAGLQNIPGSKAIGYLRFRKSNDGKIREGDVQRIDRQQQFVKSAINKTLTWRLPVVLYQGLKYVKTDVSLMTGARLAIMAQSISKDQVYFHLIPPAKTGRGKDGLSYFFHDTKKTETLIDAIRTGTWE